LDTKNGIKRIVVCGPPHSGKSVFLANLMRFLPPDKYMLIYGCPDGEGHWTNQANQALVSVIRQKGKFDQTFMTNIINYIKTADQKLILVDVGGRRTPENARIFKECDGYIILCSTAHAEEMAEWRKFGDELGLKCLAELDSSLTGESVVYPDQSDGILRGLVVGLERGTYVQSPVINKLVEIFCQIINKNGDKSLAEQQADINGATLADQINIVDRNDPWMGYRPWHIAPTLRAISHLTRKKLVKVWNIRSAFIGAALAAFLRRSMIELFDVSLGYIMVPNLRPKAKGSPFGLQWEIIEFDKYALVKFKIQGGMYNASWLHTAYPPRVNRNKGIVVVSGKSPIWLFAVIVRAYAKTNPWVSLFAAAESGREQPSLDGKKWDEVYPDSGPCVKVFDCQEKNNLGEMIAVPSELLK